MSLTRTENLQGKQLRNSILTVSEWERIKDKLNKHRNLQRDRLCVVKVEKWNEFTMGFKKSFSLYTTDIKMFSFRTKIFLAIGLLLLRL